jgi:hypothetical protein
MEDIVFSAKIIELILVTFSRNVNSFWALEVGVIQIIGFLERGSRLFMSCRNLSVFQLFRGTYWR